MQSADCIGKMGAPRSARFWLSAFGNGEYVRRYKFKTLFLLKEINLVLFVRWERGSS